MRTYLESTIPSYVVVRQQLTRDWSDLQHPMNNSYISRVLKNILNKAVNDGHHRLSH